VIYVLQKLQTVYGCYNFNFYLKYCVRVLEPRYIVYRCVTVP